MDAQASKVRLYGAIENVLGVSNAISRRLRYTSKQNYLQLGRLDNAPNEWFACWEEKGIDMHTVNQQKYYHYDFQMLHYFHKYGLRRFWLEDIWKYDWEAFRQYAQSLGMSNIPDYKIPKQNKLFSLFMDMITKLYSDLVLCLRYVSKLL